MQRTVSYYLNRELVRAYNAIGNAESNIESYQRGKNSVMKDNQEAREYYNSKIAETQETINDKLEDVVALNRLIASFNE